MSEQMNLDSFEQRISAELERYVAEAFDPTPAAEVAAAAMRPRRLVTRMRSAPRSRRLLLLGLAATLVIPTAYLAATTVRPSVDDIANVKPSPTTLPATAPTSRYRAVIVRRDGGSSATSTRIYAVRLDGAERLLLEIPDASMPTPAATSSDVRSGALQEWGSVDRSGWLALGTINRPWSLVLVDLTDVSSDPWVVDEASVGGAYPAWGPAGLLAATSGPSLVIVDPAAHSVQRMPFPAGGLIGGSPSIVWNAAGTAIVAAVGDGPDRYKTVPIDGSGYVTGFPTVYPSRAGYADHGDTLRLCAMGEMCSTGDRGQVERTAVDGSFTTIYEPGDSGRVLEADFGARPDEYLLLLDDHGQSVLIDRLSAGTTQNAAQVTRGSDWNNVGGIQAAADGSFFALGVDRGNDDFGVVTVPANGAGSTVHKGAMAGFVDASLIDTADATGAYVTAGEPIVPGTPYAMPPLEQLIANEVGPYTVMLKGARDGVPGDTAEATYQLTATGTGQGSLHISCRGPASVTVSGSFGTQTDSCMYGGLIGSPFQIQTGDQIDVHATGDTTWRVFFFGSCDPYTPPGGTPAPVCAAPAEP